MPRGSKPKKDERHYRTLEERFGPGAKLDHHSRGAPTEPAGFVGTITGGMAGDVQRKLTPKEEGEVKGNRMKYISTEMAKKKQAEDARKSRDTDSRPMVFGRDKTGPKTKFE